MFSQEVRTMSAGTRLKPMSDTPSRNDAAPKTIGKDTIRLNRYLALCGAGARRKVEEFIINGRVRINGEVVTEPGRQVAGADEVELDGQLLSRVTPTYLIYNKPAGIISAVEDSRERTIIDVLPPSLDSLRLFPVGRLDRESEGLIILTNDGMFSQELIHPGAGITKTYEVELRKPLAEGMLLKWREGVAAEERFLKPIAVCRIDKSPRNSCFEVVLGEGIKREIRLMARALGNDVRRLKRRKIGKLELRYLPSGEFISVSKEELWRFIRDGKIV